jgi:hypothetical protein
MTAQTATTRKALERQRKREAGLTPLEVWARPADHAAIKALAAKLARGVAGSGVQR